MEIFNDNNTKPVKSTNLQGGENNGNRKFGNRRALSVINHIVGGHNYPCVVNKRGLSKINVVCDKINNPITRSTKKPKTGANDFSVWEEEEEEEEKDVEEPVPMSFEQTETISEEKDQTEEIEMEDIFEEGVIDIDNSDAKNPLAVVEYIEDMYAFYKKIEVCVSPNYMANIQSDINERMRAILIDWLIEVHHKFELREETLFLTVNLIDRFLAKQVVVRKKLQLVGLVAMLLACKYEEVSVPVVDDLVFISDKAYSRTQIIETERLMLNTLQFNMAVPTGYVFMRRFLKAAQSDQKLELLSFFLMELSLVEYEMLQFSPSFVAAASIYTAQCTLYGVGQWNKTCEWYTSYTEDQLSECSRLIVGYHQKAGTGKLTGIYRKYSTSRYGYAAKCEPAHFLVKTE